jgi:D-arabinose 1-dehydrogenase-like Zn-dependent alcohol dehydrogenase
MKAIVQEKYGSPEDVLELKEIDKPVVKDDEVLLRVHAASVHPDVWHVVRGRPYVLRIMGAGLLKPKNGVPGTDVAGHVESVGKNVAHFRAGDEVFGESVRGHQWHNGGAYAEYASIPEDQLALKPANVTFEQAAAAPTSGLIALQILPNGERPQPGHSVLVNGAGGGVGAFAVQIAKAYGANVTGVDNPEKLEMVRSLGADQVVDYTREKPEEPKVAVPERYPESVPYEIPVVQSYLLGKRVTFTLCPCWRAPPSQPCSASITVVYRRGRQTVSRPCVRHPLRADPEYLPLGTGVLRLGPSLVLCTPFIRGEPLPDARST